MKKSTIILVVLAIIIIGVIFLILYIKGSEGLNTETANCISSKSTLYASSTCSHCAEQEDILGQYADSFEIVDCLIKQDLCELYNITSVPTWVIENKSYPGVKTVSQLKSLAGC